MLGVNRKYKRKMANHRQTRSLHSGQIRICLLNCLRLQPEMENEKYPLNITFKEENGQWIWRPISNPTKLF